MSELNFQPHLLDFEVGHLQRAVFDLPKFMNRVAPEVSASVASDISFAKEIGALDEVKRRAWETQWRAVFDQLVDKQEGDAFYAIERAWEASLRVAVYESVQNRMEKDSTVFERYIDKMLRDRARKEGVTVDELLAATKKELDAKAKRILGDRYDEYFRPS